MKKNNNGLLIAGALIGGVLLLSQNTKASDTTGGGGFTLFTLPSGGTSGTDATSKKEAVGDTINNYNITLPNPDYPGSSNKVETLSTPNEYTARDSSGYLVSTAFPEKYSNTSTKKTVSEPLTAKTLGLGQTKTDNVYTNPTIAKKTVSPPPTSNYIDAIFNKNPFGA